MNAHRHGHDCRCVQRRIVDNAIVNRTHSILLAIGIAVMLTLAGVVGYNAGRDSWTTRTTSTGNATVTVERIQNLSKIVTLRVGVAEVVEIEKERVAQIPWTNQSIIYGGVHVVYLARGDALLGTDLKAAKITTDEAARKVKITLPNPTVLSAQVDAQRSRFYAVDTKRAESVIPGDLKTPAIEEAIRKAQQAILEEARKPDYAKIAKENAESILRNFCQSLGWSAEIEWEKK